MKRVVLCSLVAACGGTDVPPDALAGCQVELTGNAVESVSAASCAMLAPGVGATEGDTLLQLAVPSQQLGGELRIDVDLGPAPTPGVYTSGTTALWTAMAVKTVPPAGACLFLAGNNATPTGYFTLELTAIDAVAVHGDLSLTLFVLPRTADDGTPTDCGAGTTEDAQIRF